MAKGTLFKSKQPVFSIKSPYGDAFFFQGRFVTGDEKLIKYLKDNHKHYRIFIDPNEPEAELPVNTQLSIQEKLYEEFEAKKKEFRDLGTSNQHSTGVGSSQTSLPGAARAPVAPQFATASPQDIKAKLAAAKEASTADKK